MSLNFQKPVPVPQDIQLNINIMIFQLRHSQARVGDGRKDGEWIFHPVCIYTVTESRRQSSYGLYGWYLPFQVTL